MKELQQRHLVAKQMLVSVISPWVYPGFWERGFTAEVAQFLGFRVKGLEN